jgi:hypothetical protein
MDLSQFMRFISVPKVEFSKFNMKIVSVSEIAKRKDKRALTFIA